MDEGTKLLAAPEKPKKTGEERFQAARKFITEAGPDVFYDVLLLTAWGEPMLLIEALVAAGAQVREAPIDQAPMGPAKKETVN